MTSVAFTPRNGAPLLVPVDIIVAGERIGEITPLVHRDGAVSWQAAININAPIGNLSFT